MMDHLKPKDPSMACYFLLNITIILSSSLFPVCASEDILRAGESINTNQTLTSAGGNFALGFFSPGNSTNRYIGIWYKTISKQTVIWVANRENLLAQNSTAVFRLGDDGNLVIFYGRGQVVWSTNATILILAIDSTVAQLSDNGNLVLRLGDDTLLWQSFN
ncbi:G-type lectin S-receptor-like serine/threonine-protein kinase At1g11303 [Camellia sinensis]|uniref:G-type lectin S-receptor-like serine/threonine-protein kinase At1g11303 n=1 Tax=Camellia sinensis TaxID=4442 RepID=UPI0010369AB7|nr:G-type lectin S-receptor-like serine/threonine-protein kinase At1g11303 [Camellia sinensis]